MSKFVIKNKVKWLGTVSAIVSKGMPTRDSAFIGAQLIKEVNSRKTV